MKGETNHFCLTIIWATISWTILLKVKGMQASHSFAVNWETRNVCGSWVGNVRCTQQYFFHWHNFLPLPLHGFSASFHSLNLFIMSLSILIFAPITSVLCQKQHFSELIRCKYAIYRGILQLFWKLFLGFVMNCVGELQFVTEAISWIIAYSRAKRQ